MTDREIIQLILNNSIIYVGNIPKKLKREVHDKLQFITGRDGLESHNIKVAVVYYLEEGSRILCTKDKDYFLNTFNEEWCKKLILLTADQILLLFKIYTDNNPTKESLKQIMNNININEQKRYKGSFIKRILK